VANSPPAEVNHRPPVAVSLPIASALGAAPVATAMVTAVPLATSAAAGCSPALAVATVPLGPAAPLATPAEDCGTAPAGSSASPGRQEVDTFLSCNGEWEVHTVKRGWAPLAPALQPALNAAMDAAAERVEVLVDPVVRSWVADPAMVAEAVRQRCVVYVALPRQRMMGKVGGEPPRPVRWRAAGDAVKCPRGEADVASMTRDLGLGSTEGVTPGIAECARTAAAEEAPAAMPNMSLVHATCWDEEDVEPAEEEEEGDLLTFTAKPADGVFINSAVFERLQHGISARGAAHRYAGQVLAT